MCHELGSLQRWARKRAHTREKIVAERALAEKQPSKPAPAPATAEKKRREPQRESEFV